MKVKTKALMVFTILSLVSVMTGTMPATAVKVDGVLQVKSHIKAEGIDSYDASGRVEIAVDLHYVPYISSGLDKASFKRIILDVDGEEKMQYHGELKEGTASWVAEWWDENAQTLWHSVWFISGIGNVKAPPETHEDVFIGIIICLGEAWAYAAFYEGPWINPLAPPMLAPNPVVEEIGAEKFPDYP